MKKSVCLFILFLILVANSTGVYAAVEPIRIGSLKVEYMEMPLGVDVEKPRFSWQMQSDMRGVYQTAYQIVVISENGRKVWDSGKVQDNTALNIQYEGEQLRPCTKYVWEVMVWDQKKKLHKAESWFETGMMSRRNTYDGWNGARWIGGNDEDLVLYAQYLPVFKLNFSVQLDKDTETTKAGFIYGANDIRLLDKNRNYFQVENEKDESYIRIELSTEPMQTDGKALLNVYRVGYHPDDRADVPYGKYEIPAHIVNLDNRYDAHTVYMSSVLGYTHIYIDTCQASGLVAQLNLNPLGQGGDFIAFPVLGDIGFCVPSNMSASFSNIEIRNYRSPSNALFTDSNVSKISGGDKGIFFTKNVDNNAMPMLRTTFDTAPKQIEKARLYVTARGIYEMYMNGERVGHDCFNPGLSQYNKTHFYQAYDVTSHILSGKNAIGAVLGEGWWSGGSTFMGDFWNFFGDRQSLLAKLLVRYSDGSEETFVTHPDRWSYYNDGPVSYSSFFQGEVYDAEKEAVIKGWSRPDYIERNWKRTVEVPLQGTINSDSVNLTFNMPLVNNYSDLKLIGDIGFSPGKVRQLTAVSVNEVRPGVFIYDMGQNMVGVPKIRLSGQSPGTKITLRYAEMLYPELPEYQAHVGMLMLENIRAAMAQDIYITKGGDETINPHFTFHGYRYIEIAGITSPLPIENVKGEVISSIRTFDSRYETSNPAVNKLWENITWSALANFLSIPTDCPQRNERLGWSGDISVFSRTATYLSNVSQFLDRHMLAMRNVQREDGRFPDIAPLGGGFGGVLWGSAGITVAWEVYQQYNDKRLLIEHYPAMKNYIQYILDKNIDPQTNILIQENPGAWGNLGDWLGPEDSKNDKTLLWESYFIYDLQLMEKIATLLEKKDDQLVFKKTLEERKTFFLNTYIDPVTYKTIHSGFGLKNGKGRLVDTQTSYVLPLAFGIIPDEKKDVAGKNFVSTITRDNTTDDELKCPPYSLMTGFIGTAWMNGTLSEYGYNDAAYRLLQQKAYPSWLYSVEQGATTIWERLNSYTHINGFGGNNQMNSFNHYSFGAIGAWMYNYSLGIARDENEPGFQHFILQPEPDPTGEMTYAKGYYDSMYGRIESGWEYKSGAYYYSIVIPGNTTATLLLKASSADFIVENGKPLSGIKEVMCIGKKKDKYQFKLGSGKYLIKVDK